MTWHQFSVTGAVLQTGGLEKSQNALVPGCQLFTQLSIFEGSLAELLRFGCCQVQKMKTSRRISFWTLLCTNIKEVSQNFFVFDLADRQTDRQTDRQIDSQINRQIDRQVGRQIDRQIDRERQREIDRQIDRQKERQIDRRQIGRQVGRQIGRQIVRERERKRGDLKHLSIHQWIRFAIPDSQQPTSPIGFLFLKLPPPPYAILLVSK